MTVCCDKLFVYFLIFVIFTECNCKIKFKDSIFQQKALNRHRRSIDGNDLPPLPLTSSSSDDGVPLVRRVEEGGEEQHDSRGAGSYRYVSSGTSRQHTDRQSGPTDDGMVSIGSDPQIEFRSHVDSSGTDTRTQESSTRDPPRPGSGYRYTSTVYSGPGVRTAYRYRPPYNQLGTQRGTSYNQPGTERGTYPRTQYSPYVGSGVSYNPGGSRVQYVGSRGRYPHYNRNEPVYGGSSNYIPNRGVLSNDPTCPADMLQVYINNMRCSQAINTLGSFICYNYERVSQECCERCLSLKRAANTGCEYGDWSYQCRHIEPFDCYNSRSRKLCCETCRNYKERHARERRGEVTADCEYGNLTPRCQIISEKKHLCYLPENQRLCCETCPSLADRNNTGCQWGDQNPRLCTPFDEQGLTRINCYIATVRIICCQACESVRSRVRDQIPGCEFGDRPVSFSTDFGIFDCRGYIHRFGIDMCTNNRDVARHCCHTCFRYRQHARSGKK